MFPIQQQTAGIIDQVQQQTAGVRAAGDEWKVLFGVLFGNHGRKVFKRSEIEQKRIQKLREEEKWEADAKRLRQSQNQNQSNSSDPNSSSNPNFKLDSANSKTESGAGSSSKPLTSDELKIDALNLPKQKVIRRLRFLKQPVTLFGDVRRQQAFLEHVFFYKCVAVVEML